MSLWPVVAAVLALDAVLGWLLLTGRVRRRVLRRRFMDELLRRGYAVGVETGENRVVWHRGVEPRSGARRFELDRSRPAPVPVGVVEAERVRPVARPRERRGQRRRTSSRAGPDDSDSDGEGPHVGRRRGAPA